MRVALLIVGASALLDRSRQDPAAAPADPVAPPADGAVPPAAPAGAGCIGWRMTAGCTPSGPRNQVADLTCADTIGQAMSGFCECEGYIFTAAVPCGHAPHTCMAECARVTPTTRETYGAIDKPRMDAAQAKIDEAVASPYEMARMKGNQAVTAVNQAVDASRKAVDAARNMMGKIVNADPWKELDKAGREAQEAGVKVQEMARLARPFIYLQDKKDH